MADKKYVPNGAYLLCDKGAKPSKLTVSPTNVTLYSELFANEFDALPVLNVPDFGACILINKCVPATVKWQHVVENGVTVGRGRPIVEDSILPCQVGGTIHVFMSLAAATAAATNQAAAEDAKAKAAKAKEAAGVLFWAGVGLAVVVGVAAIALTGGAAAPLVALAAETALEAAAVGAAAGAVAGGVAGGVDGYNKGGLAGAAAGALPGAASGAVMGSAAGVVTALGGGLALVPSAMAFGYGVYEDSRATYYEPTLGNALVVFSDAVTIGVGVKAGEAVRPRGAAPEPAAPEAPAPAPAEPAAPAAPEVFSGRRPAAPERPVVDANGELTPYGKWYYQRPSGYHKGVRDNVWDAATKADAPGKNAPDGNVYDPITEEPMNPSDPWDMGHKPGYEFRKHQQSAAERGIGAKQFTKEHNNPDHYRPEKPSSNRSHQGEDMTDDYFGD